MGDAGEMKMFSENNCDVKLRSTALMVCLTISLAFFVGLILWFTVGYIIAAAVVGGILFLVLGLYGKRSLLQHALNLQTGGVILFCVPLYLTSYYM